jgi:prepilin peptidase CpaA
MQPLVAGAVWILTAAGCWTDIRALRIPNWLTVGFAAIGLAYHGIAAGWPGLAAALAGGAAGAVLLWFLYRCGGVGAGDVKWFGAFGIWAGADAALELAIYAVLAAGAIGGVLFLLRLPGLRRWGERLPWPWGPHPVRKGSRASFPFMLAVAPGLAWMGLGPSLGI